MSGIKLITTALQEVFQHPLYSLNKYSNRLTFFLYYLHPIFLMELSSATIKE